MIGQIFKVWVLNMLAMALAHSFNDVHFTLTQIGLTTVIFGLIVFKPDK